MNSHHIDRPLYLTGTFDWRGLGYGFYLDPPQNLLADQVSSDDPWNCIGQFLARCRNGVFPDSGQLQQIIEQDNVIEPVMLEACYDLLSDVAGKREIEFLEYLMKEGSRHQRLSACWAAQWTGSIDLLPGMLSAYGSLSRRADKDEITAAISNLLEAEYGDEDLELYEYEGDEETYISMVMQRRENLLRSWPAGTRIYGGKPLDTSASIVRFRGIVQNMVDTDKIPQESVIVLRRLFESATGTDCRDMFINQRFNPQGALDILNHWIDSNTLELNTGVKYFFNRPCTL